MHEGLKGRGRARGQRGRRWSKGLKIGQQEGLAGQGSHRDAPLPARSAWSGQTSLCQLPGCATPALGNSPLCLLPASLVWHRYLPAYLVSCAYILLQVNAVLHVHLPDGPTAHYKLTNLVLGKDIKVNWGKSALVGVGSVRAREAGLRLMPLLLCWHHAVHLGLVEHSFVNHTEGSTAVGSAPALISPQLTLIPTPPHGTMGGLTVAALHTLRTVHSVPYPGSRAHQQPPA